MTGTLDTNIRSTTQLDAAGSWPRRRGLVPALASAACVLALAGCEAAPPAASAPRASASRDAVTVVETGQTCEATDAHAAHRTSGIGCVTCHPCGGAFGFTSVLTYTGGTTTAGGTVTGGTDGVPVSCSVGCHSPLGSPPHTIAWNEPGPLACTACHDAPALLVRAPQHPQVTNATTRAECQVCHDTSAHTGGTVAINGHDVAWMDTASETFHAYAANRGLASCQGCHLPDFTGGATQVACATCHEQNLPEGVASWQQNCLMCHGGVETATGAPPRTTWGNGGDAVRVGAHTAHLTPSAISPGFDCGVCHVKPTDALSPGHVDPSTAEVTFAGIAVGGVTPAPAWDRASATCNGTYCHGATMGGSTPVWTRVGQGEGDCGTCHGVPPPPPHPATSIEGGYGRCAVCHPLTIDEATGGLIPPAEGGAHLNGVLEASGHDTLWMDTSDATFHAYSVNRNLPACTGCHGEALDGGVVGVGCGECHDRNLPPGVASWAVNCVMCHGGGLDATGAPPKALWGYAGDPARGGGIADPLRVGAHAKHLATTLTTSVTCASCHVVPAQALAPGHADGGDSLATVTWSGVVLTGGVQPRWDRTAGTCSSTYCHGSYSGVFTYGVWDWGIDDLVYVDVPYAGANATPGWTDGPLTCGSCHGNPPAGYWHSTRHGSTATHRECQLCHPDATGTNAGGGAAITVPGRHIDGKLDVTPKWGSGCGCH